MNERIKELNLQAMSIVMNGNDPDGDIEQMYIPSEFTKKFAELIVKECVSTLNEMHMWQSVNNQNYPSAWHDAVDNGIETIKEHFGVEE